MIDWTKTNADIIAELDTNTWVPSNLNITLAHIREILPAQAYGLVRLTLASAAIPQGETPEAKMMAEELSDAIAAMRTVGLSLSAHDRQAVIDALALIGAWPDVVRDAVKALGGVWKKSWQIEGYETLPTDEQIQTLRLKDERQTIHQSNVTLLREMEAASATANDNGDDPTAAMTAVWEAAFAGE